MRKLFYHILFVYVLIIFIGFFLIGSISYFHFPISLIVTYYLLRKNYFSFKNLKYGFLIFLILLVLLLVFMYLDNAT